MGFAYDFEFLHAFLINKKNKIQPQKNGGGSSLHPQQACEPVKLLFGGAETERSACAMGKQGPPLANPKFQP